MKITAKIFDLYGDHNEEQREYCLHAFKMDIPDAVTIEFDAKALAKLDLIRTTCKSIDAQEIFFYVDANLELFRDDRQLKVTQFEEFGIHNTFRTDSVRLSYDTFYGGFKAHMHYNCSYSERCFESNWFKILIPIKFIEDTSWFKIGR